MDPIQVVAGALYKFTLQLEHTQSKECAIRDETEECKVLFLCIVVVWRGFQFLFFISIFLQGGRLGEKVAGLQGGSVGPDHLQTRLAKLHRAITP